MYHLVEALADETTLVSIAGQEFPAPSVIEDDADGIRSLVLISDRIVVSHWVRAHASGASVLCLCAESPKYHFMLVEEFLEGYEEDQRLRVLVAPSWSWRASDRYLSYHEIFATEPGTALAVIPGALARRGFVHLHAHSEFSALDGLSTITEMVERAVADDQSALAITDHGVCAGHPMLQQVTAKAGIKPIFGIEANFVDDRHSRGDGTKGAQYDYRHLILWAMNDTGLLNLWGASTEANREGFYGRPRMDWETLRRFNDGVMCSTACLRGPVSDAILRGDEDLARKRLAQLCEIFGDRLYVELHTNAMPDQRVVNEVLVAFASQFSLPLIAVSDSHYPCVDDKRLHTIWLRAQTNKDLTDDAGLFDDDHGDFHLFTQAEARVALDYLPVATVDEAIDQTVAVADRCNAALRPFTSDLVFSKEGGAEHDFERVLDLCIEAWPRKVNGKAKSQEVYEARLEREMDLLRRKGFMGYFLMVADYVRAAKQRWLVGPGRGSGGASLVAYLMDITEIDPVDADLLFERFMTEGRESPPDFDIDFPASSRPWIESYIGERWGEENVVRVGTHVRFQSKGVVRKVFSVMKDEHPSNYLDIEAVCKIIEKAEASASGLGIPWEDLWIEHAEVLDPYREAYPENFAICDRLVQRLSTYGRHPAGVVISADEPLTDRLPMRVVGEKGSRQLVCEFDMDVMEMLHLLKFDFLTLRTLDTIQMCADLVKADIGIAIDIYDWKEQYSDPQVWEEIANGRTTGIFQIETPEGTKYTKLFQPRSIHDLADVITIVRPGPKRSGLTDTFLRRRAGEEPVTYPDPRLEAVLAKRHGCILYQEDVMAVCMLLAGYDENHADTVRKILGKKKIELVDAEGALFVPACVERGMPEGAARELWAQMAEFSRYSFNLAHAYGYAVLGYWTAWFKFHFPRQFLVAALSTVDKDRIPDFVGEARRIGYRVLPPSINLSGHGFGGVDTEIRYGLDSVKGVGGAAVEAITAGQPYASWDDFLERKGSAANVGIVKTLASVGAFDEWFPNRRALEQHLADEAAGVYERCYFKDESFAGPNGLPCHFDWDNEAPKIGKSGRPLKAKPLPKRCTKACRNYTPPEMSPLAVAPYTDEEIRERERELLGVYLSSTPFDGINREELATFANSEDLDNGDYGNYDIVGTVVKVSTTTDRHERDMAFLQIQTPVGVIDVTVFSSLWKGLRPKLVLEELVVGVVHKDERGMSLLDLVPV